MFYIDLDEIDILSKTNIFFSHNRFNVFTFKDSDHLCFPYDATRSSVKQNILRFISMNGIDVIPDRIMLLTNLSVFGYTFNPVSFYFCFDRAGAPICAVAEVSNTFGEMKPYFIGRENFSAGAFRLRVTKYFYVSPFIDHEAQFDFQLIVPEKKLNIRIDDLDKNGHRFFISTLTGTKRSLTQWRLFLYILRFPLITLQIIVLIHWNALRLYFKKLPFYRKSENPELQRDVYRRGR